MKVFRSLQEKAQKATTTTQGITPRAVIIGLLLVSFLCTVTPYTDLVMGGTLLASDHLPVGVIGIFFVLMAIINPILRALPLKKPFTSAELVTIYVMMLVAAGIPSFGLTAYLFPMITAPYYFATAENKWESTIFQYIPRWFAPTQKSVIKPFYEGLKPWETIPWGAWLKPLVGWSIFIFALYLVTVCMAAILRKQWVERERLSFPLVQLPLEMTRDEGAPGGNTFFKNKLVWIGVAIPAVIHSLNALHTSFPAVPEIMLKNINITASLVDRPWNALNGLNIFVYFSVIGFSYMLSSEVGLGLWLFYILYRFQMVIASAVGYEVPYIYGYGTPSFQAHQMAGAFFVIVVYSMWLARRQLADVIRRAFGRQAEEPDDDEPLSYPAAFWGFIIGTAILVAWCVVAGMTPVVALAMILLFYVIMVAMAKFVADGGLLFVQAAFGPGHLMGTAVGTPALGPANLTILNVLQFIFMYDMRGYLMPSVMDSLRLGDGPKLRRRSLFTAIVLALVVGVIVSYISTLAFIYIRGGIKMQPWFLVQGNVLPYGRAIQQILNPTNTNWTDIGFTGVGAVVCGFLMFMRQHYVGWPIHPIGYAMGATLPLMEMWFPIFAGWAFKSIILRYGGRRSYVQFRPLFLGLILGEFGIAALWLLIDFFTTAPLQAHTIFP